MFILDESEIYYMSDIRKLLEQDRLEFETVHKLTTDFSLEYLRSYSCGDVSLSCKNRDEYRFCSGGMNKNTGSEVFTKLKMYAYF